MVRRPTRRRAVDRPPQPPMHRTCGTMEVHNRLLELHPEYRAALGRLEMATRARIASRTAAPDREVTIPVVVHVVYRTNAENISDQQVQSEIDALNKDYSATNPDRSNVPPIWSGLVSDSMIRFALAKIDPDGNSTSGITRTKTTVTSFPQDDSVKSIVNGGAGTWPSDKYLNLWVCRRNDRDEDIVGQPG
jgi:hypothetical protein